MQINNKGFTLIELMTVVAIIGILASVGAINMLTQLPSRNLNRAAREIVSEFRRARAVAVKLNRSVTIVFNATGNSYSVDGRPGVPQGYSGLSDYYGSGISFGFPGRFDPVTFAGDEITFNAMGIPSLGGAASGYAYVQNAEGAGYRVGVRGLAGNIVMERCGHDGVDCTTD